MKILFQNLLPSAAYTVTSEFVNYRLSDCLNDNRLVRKYRTSAKTGQVLAFDFGAAVDPSHFAIIAHNLTKTAEIRIQASAASDFGTVSVNELVDMSVSGGTDNRVVFPLVNTAAYRYWRITISDSANTSAMLYIGKVYLGPALVMPSFDPEVQFTNKTTATASKSESLQLYGTAKTDYEQITVKFNSISHAERILVENMVKTVGIHTPLWLLLYEDDQDMEPVRYMNLTEPPEFKKLSAQGSLYSMTLKFEECK